MKKIEIISIAKINIGLNIVKKRKDGYHNLETIFYPLLLSDIIRFEMSNSTRLETNSAEIKNLDSNLVIDTIKLMENELKRELHVNVYIQKNIPIGAGLGGGSSNAASTLKAINKLYNLNLDYETLSSFALQLGSDVPYFLTPVPSYAASRGELLTRIQFSLGYPILLVNPGIHISTKWAFEKIIPGKNKSSLKAFFEKSKIDFETMMDYVTNDFEEIVFNDYPEIANIKDKLYEYGAEFALMTGTGSTVFGIFRNLQKARKAEEIFSQSNYTYLNNPFETGVIT
ncbi:MAG: 4-(cytidine 5'-diphospho)-2-C-methyl-D-erythritol kinase [Ignavibacteria bacterium]|nr:4-(cytidine 5'-diphospho)-2-C-methyl-D-erythritol kinase [Ignavibacteria bacterium]